MRTFLITLTALGAVAVALPAATTNAHRIEQLLSRKTAITIAAFIVDGRGAITMAGATTMPRSWSLRRPVTTTTTNCFWLAHTKQESG